MEHTVAGAIKEWRKHNKVIGQVKISYKKILRKCRELSLAGGKYREYQGLCAKYQCARLTAVTKGLVPFEDKPFKAYLNKRLSKRRKLDIAHGSLNFIEKILSGTGKSLSIVNPSYHVWAEKERLWAYVINSKALF